MPIRVPTKTSPSAALPTAARPPAVTVDYPTALTPEMMSARLHLLAQKDPLPGPKEPAVTEGAVLWTTDPMAADPGRSPALAAAFKVAGDDGVHVVTIGVSDRTGTRMSELSLHCGNPWLSGTAADRKDTLAAIAGATVDADSKIPRDAAQGKVLTDALDRSYGTFAGDESCSFIAGSGTISQYDCPHVRAVAKALLNGVDPQVQRVFKHLGVSDATGMMEQLKLSYQGAENALDGVSGAEIQLHHGKPKAASRPRARTAAAPSSPEEQLLADRRAMEEELRGRGRIFQEFLTMNSVDNPLPVPYGVFGPAGWGKTHAGRTIGTTANAAGTKLFDEYQEICVQPGAEAREFIGSIMPVVNPTTGERSFMTVDGPLAQAWRSAAAGKRVLLVVDEVNNLDERTWKMWKSTLNPFQGKYPLQTDGVTIDASGRPSREMIYAPQRNLSIYMAGNVGPGFDNPLRDPAVPSRIVESYFGPTREMAVAASSGDKDALRAMKDGRSYLERVMEGKLDERGFTKHPVIAVQKMFDQASELVISNQLDQLPSPRDLAWAVDASPSERDLPRFIAIRSRNWAVRDPDGYINAGQAKNAVTVVARAFAVADPSSLTFGR